MASVVNDEAVVDNDGVEALLFPLLVPVAVFGLAYVIADGDVGEGERQQQLV